MYIKEDTLVTLAENITNILVKRDDEEEEKPDITGNDKTVVATRLCIIVIVLSWYVYGKYGLLSFLGLRRHKNYNFLFPLAASLFAFVNNTNDIIAYVYHPQNCYPFFAFFVASATLNWAPISWLQAYRLILIAKIYLPKKGTLIVSIIAICLSCIYCAFYFCNLSIFSYTKSDIMGCGVTNEGTYTYYVMISDIVDSVYAFGALTILIFRSIKNLRELNTRNEKLNDLVGQGVLELLIIAISKIIIYPLIALTSYIPAFDIFWDILSIVVIICAYKLVYFPYEHSNNNGRSTGSFRKSIFNALDSNSRTVNIGSNSNNSYGRNGSVSGSNGNFPKYTKTEPTEKVESSLKKEIYNDA